MAEERCEHTEMLVAECNCHLHGGPRLAPGRPENVSPAPRYEGVRPPKDAILVHSNGNAHWFGCQHLPGYEYLVPPTWGWIDDHALWPRIGNHEVPATGGNTDLVAVRRCLDCD